MRPIEWAAHYGSEEVYNLLIKQGAKPLTKKKKSLYHFIYLSGSPDGQSIIKMDLLLKDGFSINDENSKGEGAITNAVTFPVYNVNSHGMLLYLIKKGVDIKALEKALGVKL